MIQKRSPNGTVAGTWISCAWRRQQALPPGGGRTSIEARRVWESLIAALAGDCHSVDEVFKLLEVSWPDAKNWSTFCESRLLVRALAAYSARGWLAGSVSGVEFEGQSGWVR